MVDDHAANGLYRAHEGNSSYAAEAQSADMSTYGHAASARTMADAPLEKTVMYCHRCDNLLFWSTNLFVPLTPSYATYVNNGTFAASGVMTVDNDQAGAVGSELEGCVLRPVVCRECQASHGVKVVQVLRGGVVDQRGEAGFFQCVPSTFGRS